MASKKGRFGKMGFPFFDSPPLRLFQPKIAGNGDFKDSINFSKMMMHFTIHVDDTEKT